MKLTQEDIENLNRPVTNKESVLVIKKIPQRIPGSNGFPSEFHHIFKKNMNPSHKIKKKKRRRLEQNMSHSSFMTSVTDNKTKKDLPIQKFATIYLMHYKVNYKINETFST